MISLLQENTKYFNVVAILQEKTLDAFNTVLKSINDSSNNIAENNKTQLTIYFSKALPQTRHF